MGFHEGNDPILTNPSVAAMLSGSRLHDRDLFCESMHQMLQFGDLQFASRGIVNYPFPWIIPVSRSAWVFRAQHFA